MKTDWQILGLPGAVTQLSVIEKAYASRRKAIVNGGCPMDMIALEDAYITILEKLGDESKIVDGAILTDSIFDEVSEAHIEGTPFTEPEIMTIGANIVRMLHNPWKRYSKSDWSKLMAYGQSDGQKDRQFDDVLREALLQYFGYYNDPANAMGHKTSITPRDISPELARFIFDEAGWDADPPRSKKEAHELSWLRQEMDVQNFNRTVKNDYLSTFLLAGLVIGCAIMLVYWLPRLLMG